MNAEQNKQRAKRLLIHYFETTGLRPDSDCRAEIADIVDCTVDAAVAQSEELVRTNQLLAERCELLTRALNGIYTLVSGDTLPAGAPASATLDALFTELGVRGQEV